MIQECCSGSAAERQDEDLLRVVEVTRGTGLSRTTLRGVEIEYASPKARPRFDWLVSELGDCDRPTATGAGNSANPALVTKRALHRQWGTGGELVVASEPHISVADGIVEGEIVEAVLTELPAPHEKRALETPRGWRPTRGTAGQSGRRIGRYEREYMREEVGPDVVRNQNLPESAGVVSRSSLQVPDRESTRRGCAVRRHTARDVLCLDLDENSVDRTAACARNEEIIPRPRKQSHREELRQHGGRRRRSHGRRCRDCFRGRCHRLGGRSCWRRAAGCHTPMPTTANAGAMAVPGRKAVVLAIRDYLLASLRTDAPWGKRLDGLRHRHERYRDSAERNPDRFHARACTHGEVSASTEKRPAVAGRILHPSTSLKKRPEGRPAAAFSRREVNG